MLKDNAFPYTSFVYREIFRLFSTLITNLGSTELWLKFDSKKILADYSNCNRLNFIYKNPHLNWDLKPQSTNEEEDDYSEMSDKQLYKLCKERGIDVPTRKSQKFYIKQLEEYDQAQDDWNDDDEDDEEWEDDDE